MLPLDRSMIIWKQLKDRAHNPKKNIFLRSFISDLVSKEVFAEVHIGFLMVGHTYEDIDQFFSMIATHLRKFQTICPDFESLEQETAKSFHQSPKNRSQVPRIQKMHAVEIFNYDSYYLPHINDKLAYHSIPHQFKFQKHGSDVLCHYKM